MRRKLCLLVFAISILISFSLKAQEISDSLQKGTVYGVLYDSSHNHSLPAATVAVYAHDSVLISYALTDNFGKFEFHNLPIEQPLKVICTHIGYKTTSFIFQIKAKEISVKLPSINMTILYQDLEEVVIKAMPPVSMKGDTIEFNAEAFKMDKNAVAEDLLRKLPGVIIWGDGTITVYGKEVNAILVNGKSFFNNETKVATQNIDKGAIDKVQVYKRSDNDARKDSIMEINIKLKEGKDNGFFGKVSVGKGSWKRHESNLNFNAFNAKTQVSIVGALNNVNKAPKDIMTLISNSTFKGVGLSVDYQPEFNQQGVTTSKMLGGFFKRDFSKPGGRLNELNIDYYYKNSKLIANENLSTSTLIGDNNRLSSYDSSNNRNLDKTHVLNLKYEREGSKYRAVLSTAVNIRDSKNYSMRNLESLDFISYTALSKTSNLGDERNLNESYSFRIELSPLKNKNDFHNKSILSAFDKIIYDFHYLRDSSHSHNDINFVSYVDTLENLKFNRKYDKNFNRVSQDVNIKSSTFDGPGILKHLHIKYFFLNRFKLVTDWNNTNALDFDNSKDMYLRNDYLTNRSHYTEIDERPQISLTKSITDILYGRYSKNLNISLNIIGQLIRQRNNSAKPFQDLDKKYHNFIPEISVQYRNNQYSLTDQFLEAEYKIFYDYPSVNQLVPLIDSSDIYYQYLGSPDLKPQKNKQLTLRYQYNDLKASNNFKLSAMLRAKIISDFYATNTFINPSGRKFVNLINTNGYKIAYFNANLNKAYKINKNNLFQLEYVNSTYLSKRPSFLKTASTDITTSIISNIFSINNDVSIYYSWLENLVFKLSESYHFYQSKQGKGTADLLKNVYYNTLASVSYNATKRLNVGSNISFKSMLSSYGQRDKFKIWNANVNYRCLPGNNLEITFAALDLLKQNKALINFGDSYSITEGYSNVLQQYFMLSIAFYPRQFGRKTSN
ncbi:hypothetical protein COR50_05655 [Chitinophaga caeni]|uniref:Outer membrane protein beta-barrel domain-containing protein n=1 Tax=Chitinophaga caeni TaxID=2029983 RepID=A0A291QS01_9BACT|nr:TonB-dependent receptor [Chitinophaga caeni]ATL46706.1 hypothetical protein COR50_05655 [Chitinophaga caeni]